MKFRKKPVEIEAVQWFPGVALASVEEVSPEILYSRDRRLFYVANGTDRPTSWISVDKNEAGQHEVLPFAFYDVKSGNREPVTDSMHPLFLLYVSAMQRDESPFKRGSWDGSLKPFARVKTLEGVTVAEPGDMVITGVAGEVYPCKPGIFEETFDVHACRCSSSEPHSVDGLHWRCASCELPIGPVAALELYRVGKLG